MSRRPLDAGCGSARVAGGWQGDGRVVLDHPGGVVAIVVLPDGQLAQSVDLADLAVQVVVPALGAGPGGVGTTPGAASRRSGK